MRTKILGGKKPQVLTFLQNWPLLFYFFLYCDDNSIIVDFGTPSPGLPVAIVHLFLFCYSYTKHLYFVPQGAQIGWSLGLPDSIRLLLPSYLLSFICISLVASISGSLLWVISMSSICSHNIAISSLELVHWVFIVTVTPECKVLKMINIRCIGSVDLM